MRRFESLQGIEFMDGQPILLELRKNLERRFYLCYWYSEMGFVSLIRKAKTAKATNKDANTLKITDCGPTVSNNWPANHGGIIAPRALPTTKRLVTFPEISILRSTRVTVVGNKEAAESPNPAAPTQIEVIE